MSSSDYEHRASKMGLAGKETIQQVLNEPNVTVLDVRTQEEAVTEHFDTDHKWVHTSCTAIACPMLEKFPEKLLPDKNAPVVIHCKSGRRAAKAEEVLKQKGYTKVYNAGGLVDMPKATELPKSGADASSGGCSVM